MLLVYYCLLDALLMFLNATSSTEYYDSRTTVLFVNKVSFLLDKAKLATILFCSILELFQQYSEIEEPKRLCKKQYSLV